MAAAVTRDDVRGARVRTGVRVTGVVQGVGFRPYVHALATGLGLTGLVGNDDAGVFVEVEGPPEAVEAFLARLPVEAPPLASVEDVRHAPVDVQDDDAFVIVASRRSSDAVTQIPPDTATCPDCLAEVRDPADRRHRYPFTACTYCGPRYTIVTGLPYDRPSTTMAAFPLCADCAREYDDPADRRFHAQPTACPVCGPQLWWRSPGSPAGARDAERDDALAAAMRLLADGGIVAVKGLGGYHLMVDARDAAAVARLRARKQRGDKPFALLVRDAAVAAALVDLDDDAREILTSPQAPIVLAPLRDHDDARAIAAAVAPGHGHLGVMVAGTPLHHLLLGAHPDVPGVRFDVLVATSGNLADEPLCTDPAEADTRLADIADGWLHHDRGIHVACDDSVVRSALGGLLPVRRARGYAPMPVRLRTPAPPLLAVGGELKTTLCLAAGRRAWLSQHLGDTEHLETLDLLERTATTLAELTRVVPEVIVADRHPGYLSRRWAQQRAAALGVRFADVQHHHAHLASLLAEHGWPDDEPVLGVTFDGTGFGDDGTIWGGELLLGGCAHVARVGHVRPVALPGGDAAVRRPARTALAHLHAADLAWDDDLPPVAAADDVERRVVGAMLAGGTGCTPTTSMGRVFDAVASLLDVRHDVAYEGQAAMELEALAATAAPDPGAADQWRWRLDGDATPEDPLVLDPAPALAAGVVAVRSGARPAAAARAFHEGLADSVVAAVLSVAARHDVRAVGLTGGVFANVLLTEAVAARLGRHDVRVLTHRVVPPNDGGLALGQAAVVAAGGAAPTIAAGG